MMENCESARIVNENMDKSLFLALEPETVLLYYFKNNSINKDYIKKGYFIICGLGEVNGDIVIHLVVNNIYLKGIGPSCRQNYFSKEINKKNF